MSFFAVLDKLLTMLQSWMARQEQSKQQEDRDELENNPADWFEHHFDGLSADNQQSNDKTNKT